MKCDHCNKPATVFFLQTLKNGETVRENLCERCAMERGVTDATLFLLPDEGIEDNSPQLDESTNQTSTMKPVELITSACPSCGFGPDELENTQRFGCPDCYEHFRPKVEEMLRGIHRKIEHKGKLPQGLLEKHTLMKNLEAARFELAQAVKEEDYELAANLRDRLQELQLQLDLSEAS